jgi:hypothetical protein
MLQHDAAVPQNTFNFERSEDREENQARLYSHLFQKSILGEIDEIEKKVSEKLSYRKIEEFLPENNDENSIVTVSLPNHIIHKIKEESNQLYRENRHESITLVKILDNHFKEKDRQQHVTSLLYDGKPPRKDCFEKLEKISVFLKGQQIYPNFKKGTVQASLKQILGQCDVRTFTKYYKCIDDFLKTNTGKRLSPYHEIDVSIFVETIEASLDYR